MILTVPGGGRVLRFSDLLLDPVAHQVKRGGREIAHAEDFMAADIDRRSRRVAMRQAAQRHRIGIALPDHVDVAHAHVNWPPLEDFLADVQQDAIAQVDGIVQPEQPAGRGELS